MGRKDNSARGVRLPNALWEVIDSEADELNMSRNELLTRRLTKAFFRDDENRKTVEISRKLATPEDKEIPRLR